MNATLTASLNNTTSVIGVENVNLNLNFFNGFIAADNIAGATITGSSSKLGFNGQFNVTEAGDNNIVAGTNVTELDIASLTTGTVNAGSADTVVIDTDAATDTVNLTVNGDVDLTVTTATGLLALTATAASSVTLDAATSVTEVTVTGDATLLGSAVALTGLTITSSGGVNVTADGAILDVENYTVSAIEVSTASKLAVTNADGQVFNLTAADTDFDVTGTGATGSTVTVNVSADQAGGTAALKVDGVETSSINLTAAVEELAQLTIEGESTVTVAGDVTITSFTATNLAADTITFTGSGNLDVTGDTKDVGLLVSSALTGNLTFTQFDDTFISVIAGAGDDEINLATLGANAIVVTGNGSNVVNVLDLDNGSVSVTGGSGSDFVNIGGDLGDEDRGTVAVELGDGDDTLVLAAVADSTVAADFGLGIDTLSLVNNKDYSAGAFSVAGLEIIDMNGAGVTVGSALVSGQSYIIKGGGASSTLTVVGSDETGVTIDISSLVFDQSIDDGVDATVITGEAAVGGDTIIGNALTADAITLATNAVADSVDVSTSTEAVLDSVAVFETDEDTITFGGPAGSASNYDESGLDLGAPIDAAAAITGAEALFDGTVLYAYIFNTDADGSDAPDTSAFLIYDADGDGTADNIVQLVGVAVDGDFFALEDIA